MSANKKVDAQSVEKFDDFKMIHLITPCPLNTETHHYTKCSNATFKFQLQEKFIQVISHSGHINALIPLTNVGAIVL